MSRGVSQERSREYSLLKELSLPVDSLSLLERERELFII